MLRSHSRAARLDILKAFARIERKCRK